MALRTLHIGVGGRGRWPVEMFPGRDDVAPVGLCDIRPEALAKAREATGLGDAACYEDWQTALAEVYCDAVVVVTPPQLHYEMVLAAVRAGRHVMVEKPFTMNLAEACEIVAEADERGVKVLACQQRRYSSQATTADAILAQIGPPRYGLYTTFGWRPGVHHSGHQRHSYAWERGIHDLDIVQHLFGALPMRVAAMSFNPPWSAYDHGAGMSATVEFEGGGVCTFGCSFMSHRRGGEFTLDCEGGALDLGKPMRLRRAGADEDELIEHREVPQPEASLVDRFVEWVAGGPEPLVGMHHNLWTVALVEAVGVASDEARVVDVPELMATARERAARSAAAGQG